MRVPNPTTRAFYEIEAVRESWSTRELERQIGALLFERRAKSRDREQVLALAREGQKVATAADVIKDPFVLEFLDLADRPIFRESDLESAIIARLEEFLLEMGKGFCFVARQKRITLDGDDSTSTSSSTIGCSGVSCSSISSSASSPTRTSGRCRCT